MNEYIKSCKHRVTPLADKFDEIAAPKEFPYDWNRGRKWYKKIDWNSGAPLILKYFGILILIGILGLFFYIHIQTLITNFQNYTSHAP